MANANLTLTFKTDASFKTIKKLIANQITIQNLFKKAIKTKAIDGNHAVSVEIADLLRSNGTLLEDFLKATLKAVP